MDDKTLTQRAKKQKTQSFDMTAGDKEVVAQNDEHHSVHSYLVDQKAEGSQGHNVDTEQVQDPAELQFLKMLNDKAGSLDLQNDPEKLKNLEELLNRAIVKLFSLRHARHLAK
eukprot:g3337.t1